MLIRPDDFEVSIFLTEVGTRHALMVKQKTFSDREPIKSNSNKLTGHAADPVMIREESDDDDLEISDIPAARDGDGSDPEDDFERGPDRQDDKKKLGFNTTYDGFNIWGFVLCLLVERRGGPGNKSNAGGGHAQALMEEWISTQQEQKDDM